MLRPLTTSLAVTNEEAPRPRPLGLFLLLRLLLWLHCRTTSESQCRACLTICGSMASTISERERQSAVLGRPCATLMTNIVNAMRPRDPSAISNKTHNEIVPKGLNLQSWRSKMPCAEDRPVNGPSEEPTSADPSPPRCSTPGPSFVGIRIMIVGGCWMLTGTVHQCPLNHFTNTLMMMCRSLHPQKVKTPPDGKPWRNDGNLPGHLAMRQMISCMWESSNIETHAHLEECAEH